MKWLFKISEFFGCLVTVVAVAVAAMAAVAAVAAVSGAGGRQVVSVGVGSFWLFFSGLDSDTGMEAVAAVDAVAAAEVSAIKIRNAFYEYLASYCTSLATLATKIFKKQNLCTPGVSKSNK